MEKFLMCLFAISITLFIVVVCCCIVKPLIADIKELRQQIK